MNSLSRTTRIVFAGGGTGGHLFPALAIADRIRELLADKVEIVFVGTRRGIEYRMRDRLGYPLELINIRGLVRSLSPKNLLVPFLVIASLLRAKAILKKYRPDIVIGTGGYVSWPVLKAAARRQITTVLQEQNSYPGMATRQLAGQAARVYLGFDEAKNYLPGDAHIVVTGNPVRSSVVGGNRQEAIEKFGLDPSRKTILVLGGSQGARSVNNAILKDLEADILDDQYQLLWQTGKGDYKDVVVSLGERANNHSLFPFAHQMNLVYAAADLAVARAGAITLAELSACGVPSLVIPYPFAAGDHQRKNARAYVDRGYAESIDPDELDKESPLTRARDLFESGRVDRMRNKLKQDMAGKKPAVEVIVEDILKLAAHAQEATVES
jgi:UDP-N-acetylglucosamine--N-acetylmuramyl-(pentapeptide) pyrophosphoryl-undecaprenol N-acetylglucosamine transferase